jgi:hypothetical protein
MFYRNTLFYFSQKRANIGSWHDLIFDVDLMQISFVNGICDLIEWKFLFYNKTTISIIYKYCGF